MFPRIDKTRILLTGATGFIGRHVLRKLLQRGHRVTAIVRASNTATGEERLRSLMRSCGWPDEWNQQLSVIEGALPNLSAIQSLALNKAMASCDRVIHCAAALNFDRNRDGEPQRTNVDDTIQLGKMAGDCGIRKFLYVSTAYVSGRVTSTRHSMPESDSYVQPSTSSIDHKEEIPAELLASEPPEPKSLIERNRIALSWMCCLMIGMLAVVTKSHWPAGGLMSGTLLLIGLSLALTGCIGRIWCSLYIDGFKTKQLVTCGPYSVCRNPLYFFSAIGAIGVAFGTATLAIPGLVLVCFAIYYPTIIRAEERRLHVLHRGSFSDYCRTVPAILPRMRSYDAPENYEIHPRIVGNSMLDATWFVWFTMIAHLLYQLHQRTDYLPTWFSSQ